MSKFKSIILFLSGVAVGGLSAYFITKKKYEAIVEKELADLRETYQRKKDELASNAVDSEPISEDAPEVKNQPFQERSSLDAQREMSRLNINKPPLHDYTQYYHSDDPDAEVKEPVKYAPSTKEPYVISPDEFAHEPGISEAHYVLHPNGSITDEEDGEEIDDPIGMLGVEWEKRIGEYEQNTVYIRNEKYSMDIEVVQLLPKEVPIEAPIVFKASSANPANSRKPHEVTN